MSDSRILGHAGKEEELPALVVTVLLVLVQFGDVIPGYAWGPTPILRDITTPFLIAWVLEVVALRLAHRSLRGGRWAAVGVAAGSAYAAVLVLGLVIYALLRSPLLDGFSMVRVWGGILLILFLGGIFLGARILGETRRRFGWEPRGFLWALRITALEFSASAAAAVAAAFEGPVLLARWHRWSRMLVVLAASIPGLTLICGASNPHPEIRTLIREELDLCAPYRLAEIANSGGPIAGVLTDLRGRRLDFYLDCDRGTWGEPISQNAPYQVHLGPRDPEGHWPRVLSAGSRPESAFVEVLRVCADRGISWRDQARIYQAAYGIPSPPIAEHQAFLSTLTRPQKDALLALRAIGLLDGQRRALPEEADSSAVRGVPATRGAVSRP